jgi:hypothetical protein
MNEKDVLSLTILAFVCRIEKEICMAPKTEVSFRFFYDPHERHVKLNNITCDVADQFSLKKKLSLRQQLAE